jgi:hypothetical protein
MDREVPLSELKPSEPHAGVLRPAEPLATEVFEFGGQRLLLEGTSGPPKEPARVAEGRPVRHDVSLGAAPGATGSGQLIGGPVRRV